MSATILTEVQATTLTRQINAQAAHVEAEIIKLGDLIVKAYAGRAHDVLGYETWEDYVDAEITIPGFKPEETKDRPYRSMLVAMFREVEMPYEAIAKVVKATSRTVKTDAEKAGLTSKRASKPAASKPAASKPAASAGKVVTVKPADPKVMAGIKKLVDGMDAAALTELAEYVAKVQSQRTPAGKAA